MMKQRQRCEALKCEISKEECSSHASFTYQQRQASQNAIAARSSVGSPNKLNARKRFGGLPHPPNMWTIARVLPPNIRLQSFEISDDVGRPDSISNRPMTRQHEARTAGGCRRSVADAISVGTARPLEVGEILAEVCQACVSLHTLLLQATHVPSPH